MIKNISTFSMAFFSILILLSGCNCKKRDNDKAVPSTEIGEEVLVSENGKTLLTLSEFQEFVQEAMGADPQMQFMAQLMPDFEEQLFDRAKFREVILNKWAEENKISEKEEYKMQETRAKKALETMLNQQMFIKEHVGEITDAQIRKHYDENKGKDQNLMVSPEGIEAKGLSFEKEKEALAFLEKVAALKGDIVLAAKEMKKELEDLGLVTQTSMIDPTVKDKVLEAKKVPATLPIIKAGDKEFWVVRVIKKEKAQYRPFEQAKDMLKETLMNKEIEKVFDKKVPEYIEKYGIKVNRGYFEKKGKEREGQQAKMMKQMQEQESKESQPVEKAPASKELSGASVQQNAA